jgi:magnesium-transporting ATPase (P-type)
MTKIISHGLAADCLLVGWTGPYSNLCKKRPTASLVSRKVLTPLLGQILLCIIIQAIGFKVVQRQSWFVSLRDQIRWLLIFTTQVLSSSAGYREV